MSFYRAKLRATDRNVYYDNRLTNFTNPPVYYGNLHVQNNETVGGNLDVCGNLSVGKDLSAYNFYARGNYYLNNYLLIPYGTIIQSAAVSIPGGWLLCNGASLNKIAYANLFSVIGNTYGGLAGDLSFNIPDLRGRGVIGAGQGAGLTNRALGALGGEETHTLTTSEMPSHSHTLDRRSNSDAGAFDTGDGHKFDSCASTTDRSILGSFNTYSAGSGSAHNNMQPYFALNFLIKY